MAKPTSFKEGSTYTAKQQEKINAWWIFDYLKNGTQSSQNNPMKKGFLNNFGYFLSLGGLYLSFPGNWFIQFIQIISGLSHVVLFAYTAYLKKDVLEVLIESIHFCEFLFLLCIVQMNGQFHKKTTEKIMSVIGEGVYTYGNTLDDTTMKEVNELIVQAANNKKFRTRLYVTFMGTGFIVLTILRPIGVALTQNVDYENFDGINRNIPVHCWFPIDSRVPFNNVVCWVFQYSLIVTTMFVILGLDIFFTCVSEEIVQELKIVGLSMRYLMRRAKYLIKQQKETDIKKSLALCLSESVKHHNAVIRLFRYYQQYNYHILFLMVSGAAILLCLCGFIFTSNEVPLLSKATFFFFLFGQAVHVLIICWYGEQIKQASSNIGKDIYYSDWIDHSVSMKCHLLMVISNDFRPLTLTCGGFMEASMETYGNVLSSAYSYFNLLNAVH